MCHALTGDQYVASEHPITKKDGWWSLLIGPEKSIDTNKYFVICPNVIGGCMGSTGPNEINPKTGKEYGLDFPVVTIGDMVKAQKLLIDSFGIEKLFSVIGGSMGGMLVLEWLSKFPSYVFSAIPIATTTNHSAQNIALNELARQAIMADPEWKSGNYNIENTKPVKGLSVARMAAHISYLSEQSLHEKFGRNLQNKNKIEFSFDADFQVESYLRHQGFKFVDRFDANSYLYITRAMDYFDLTKQFNGNLSDAFKECKTKFFIISFTSDWLYPTIENREIVIALVALASTEFFNNYLWAFPLAVICYWMRTTLMNMAAPMTSELTMNYVGKENQEMLSAIMAAIWSGSWFFSSQIFRYLTWRCRMCCFF